MTVYEAGFLLLAVALSSAAIASAMGVCMAAIRMRRPPSPPAMQTAVVFRDGSQKPVATITADGETIVHRPDKIRAAADALVEHLAAAAARDAAEKEFGGAP